jgi:hypothetical protein
MSDGFKPGSLDEWKGRRHIPATLPSGMNVILRTVTLDDLAAVEGLPDDLLRVALIEMTPNGVPGEIARLLQSERPESLEASMRLSRDTVALRDRLVLAAVVEPVITADDVGSLDGFDKAMIADIASRQTVEDAAGRRVYGDQPIATFPDAGEVG